MIISERAQQQGKEMGWHRDVLEQRAYDALHKGIREETAGGSQVVVVSPDLESEFRLSRTSRGTVLRSVRRLGR